MRRYSSFSFIKEFFKNPREIGALIPSSRFLAEKMVELADLSNSRYIIELGSGTGIITKEIIARMPTDSFLSCFEINKNLAEELKKEIQDPRVIIINDSAEHLDKYLSNVQKVDCIISCLPLACLSKKTTARIFDSINRHLAKDGQFIQFQYSLNNLENFKKIFSEITIKFEFRNLPPAFIYICRKNV